MNTVLKARLTKLMFRIWLKNGLACIYIALYFVCKWKHGAALWRVEKVPVCKQTRDFITSLSTTKSASVNWSIVSLSLYHIGMAGVSVHQTMALISGTDLQICTAAWSYFIYYLLAQSLL